MDQGIISMRYAKALLRFAEDNGDEQQVYGEMIRLAESFQSVPALHQALLNPVLSDEKKVKLLLTASAVDEQPSKSLSRFVRLILKKQRADVMMFVANAYGTVYREKHHVIRGRLVVPTTVAPQLLDRLCQMVEARSQSKVDFQVKEDPTIIGGFILDYDTYSLDASVRSQLARLSRALAN